MVLEAGISGTGANKLVPLCLQLFNLVPAISHTVRPAAHENLVLVSQGVSG